MDWTEAPSDDDLKNIDIQTILTAVQLPICHDYGSAFRKHASIEETAGNFGSARVFTFLSIVCHMMLDSTSRDQPFKPFFEGGGTRSHIPSDLGEAHINALVSTMDMTEDPELHARLADLHWITTRNHRSALSAIDSYVASANRLIAAETWHVVAERFTRAVTLASLLRADEKRNEALDATHMAMDEARKHGLSFLPVELMQVALRQRDRRYDYADLAEELATEAESRSHWYEARQYWGLSYQWHRFHDRQERFEAAGVKAAETLVAEASSRDSGLVKVGLLNQALDALREIPGTLDRQREIKALALEAQAQSVSEMKTVAISVDIPRNEWVAQIEATRSAVAGQTRRDALIFLGKLFSVRSMMSFQTEAEELMSATPLFSLISSFTIGDNNKVIERSQSGSDKEKEKEGRIRSQMYKLASYGRPLSVMSRLEPARIQVLNEHFVRESDMLELIDGCPFIARTRLRIYTEGLLQGLHGNFGAAAITLIPQLENSLRYILEQKGRPSFVTARDGSQHEHDLNSLLWEREIIDYLGNDVIFDLRGLLVESVSVNLRNRIAHGLMDDEQFEIPELAYFWWFMLALIVNATYTIVPKPADDSQ